MAPTGDRRPPEPLQELRQPGSSRRVRAVPAPPALRWSSSSRDRGVGTIAYSLTESVSVWQGFLFTLDTVATVGSIPTPPDLAGQIVKVLLIVLGVGTLFYALVTVTEFFVAGHLGEILEERRTLNKIEDLIRPSPDLRLRPRGAAGRARSAGAAKSASS